MALAYGGADKRTDHEGAVHPSKVKIELTQVNTTRISKHFYDADTFFGWLLWQVTSCVSGLSVYLSSFTYRCSCANVSFVISSQQTTNKWLYDKTI